MKLPHCAVCGRSCIPLADYELPTCVRCDDAMALALERAGIGPLVEPSNVVDLSSIFDEIREQIAERQALG